MKKLIQLMSKSVFLILTISIILYLKSNGQNQPVINLSDEAQAKVDSLRQIILATKQDTNKIKLLLALGKQYENILPDTTLFYYQQALDISKNIHANSFISKCLRNIGYTYHNQGSYNIANEYYLKSLKISEELSDKLGMSECYTSIGVVYKEQGSYDKAIEFYQEALKITKELNNKNGLAKCYINIGNIYKYKGSYDTAIKYFFNSLKIRKELSDKLGMAYSYINIGIIYKRKGSYDMAIEYYLNGLKIFEEFDHNRGMSSCYTNIGNIHHNQHSYDKAFEYHNKALKIAEKLGDKRGISSSYHNIGNIYLMQGSYDKALEYYLKTLKIVEEQGDIRRMSFCYINIGITYKDKGSYAKAIEYLLKALNMADEQGDKSSKANIYGNIAYLNIMIADSTYLSKNHKLDYLIKAIEFGHKSLDLAKEIDAVPEENTAANILMDAYKKLGNYSKSLEFAEIYIATQDSMFHEEKTNAIQEMETKYETEKKEAQILALENENLEKGLDLERRTNQRNLYLISGSGSILVILLLFVMYRHKANKDKIIADQKIIQLNEEKKLLAARSIVEGQEEERKRIAKELHDGLGVLLSTAKMHFTTIRDKSTNHKQLLDKAAKLLEQASGDVRKISHNMMPGLLTKFGLYEAVEDMLEQVDEAEGINAQCEIKGETARLPENTEIMIYRIIQEIINNTLKYASAKNISLRFDLLPGEISITYSDDGVGFDFEDKLNTKSIGLNSIQSRVNFLSGKLEVSSIPNKGARFFIKVPI